MKTFLLDTNILIYFYNRRGVRSKIATSVGPVAMSAIVHSELAQGSRTDEDAVAEIMRLKSAIPVLPYGEAASDAYGRIVRKIGYSSKRTIDRMIAAHAISVGAVLVTNDVQDFADIPDLALENWANPA